MIAARVLFVALDRAISLDRIHWSDQLHNDSTNWTLIFGHIPNIYSFDRASERQRRKNQDEKKRPLAFFITRCDQCVCRCHHRRHCCHSAIIFFFSMWFDWFNHNVYDKEETTFASTWFDWGPGCCWFRLMLRARVSRCGISRSQQWVRNWWWHGPLQRAVRDQYFMHYWTLSGTHLTGVFVHMCDLWSITARTHSRCKWHRTHRRKSLLRSNIVQFVCLFEGISDFNKCHFAHLLNPCLTAKYWIWVVTFVCVHNIEPNAVLLSIHNIQWRWHDGRNHFIIRSIIHDFYDKSECSLCQFPNTFDSSIQRSQDSRRRLTAYERNLSKRHIVLKDISLCCRFYHGIKFHSKHSQTQCLV